MLSSRFIGLGATAIAVMVALIVVLLGGGEDSTRNVRVALASATGLREGSLVRVNGAEVGDIRRLSLDGDDDVLADLEIDDRITVGRDARVEIKTQNLLGESTISLDPGSADRPAPSSFVIPKARVASNVQLDQVVDTLDTGTRARLAILVNEAGRALSGRSLDLDDLLDVLPGSLSEATALITALAGDTEAVRRTVESADGFVTAVAAQRRQLTTTLRSAGEATKTIGDREAALRETLARAPGSLRTLQTFLADLRRTTSPLGEASDALRATAPSLQATLDELGPFRTAAKPTLKEAADVAPAITKLSAGATPVVKRTGPSLASAADLFENSTPFTDAVDKSVDDAFGFMEGWARAIQNRDGIGHIFRGGVVLSTDAVRTLLASLPEPKSVAKKAPSKKGARAPVRETRPEPERPATPTTSPKPDQPDSPPPATIAPLQELPKRLGDLLGGILGSGATPRNNAPGQLLDRLLHP